MYLDQCLVAHTARRWAFFVPWSFGCIVKKCDFQVEISVSEIANFRTVLVPSECHDDEALSNGPRFLKNIYLYWRGEKLFRDAQSGSFKSVNRLIANCNC
jgi:hypothetical protein